MATTKAAPATVISQSFDGVQLDSPGTPFGSPGGPVLHLSAFESTTVYQPKGQVSHTTESNLNVAQEECFEFSGGWLASRYGVPTVFRRLQTRLIYGPTPGQATLNGTFECTSGDGATFPLNVNLRWSADPEDMEASVFPWHPAGVPGGAIAGVRALADVTGSVSDGSTEFLPADATGPIYHATDTQVYVS